MGSWIDQELAGCVFADKRLGRRFGVLMEQLSKGLGQTLPPEQRMPVRKRVRQRRLRSVIQDMVYLACRLVRHARRWSLAFWKNNPWRPVWERVYGNRPAEHVVEN